MGHSPDINYLDHVYERFVTDNEKATLFETPNGYCWVNNAALGIVEDDYFTYNERFTLYFFDSEDDAVDAFNRSN